MQSIESFKLKETPNTVPKPPPTYFPLSNTSVISNGSPRHTATGNKPQMLNNKNAATNHTLEFTKISPSATSPTNGAQSTKSVNGKVAIRIGSYEGESKQPSKLEFLSQTSREKTETDDPAQSNNDPVVSRLQNELAATLQRSNLRRKTDGVSDTDVRQWYILNTIPNLFHRSVVL